MEIRQTLALLTTHLLHLGTYSLMSFFKVFLTETFVCPAPKCTPDLDNLPHHEYLLEKVRPHKNCVNLKCFPFLVLLDSSNKHNPSLFFKFEDRSKGNALMGNVLEYTRTLTHTYIPSTLYTTSSLKQPAPTLKCHSLQLT